MESLVDSDTKHLVVKRHLVGNLLAHTSPLTSNHRFFLPPRRTRRFFLTTLFKRILPSSRVSSERATQIVTWRFLPLIRTASARKSFNSSIFLGLRATTLLSSLIASSAIKRFGARRFSGGASLAELLLEAGGAPLDWGCLDIATEIQKARKGKIDGWDNSETKEGRRSTGYWQLLRRLQAWNGRSRVN